MGFVLKMSNKCLFYVEDDVLRPSRSTGAFLLIEDKTNYLIETK